MTSVVLVHSSRLLLWTEVGLCCSYYCWRCWILLSCSVMLISNAPCANQMSHMYVCEAEKPEIKAQTTNSEEKKITQQRRRISLVSLGCWPTGRGRNRPSALRYDTQWSHRAESPAWKCSLVFFFFFFSSHTVVETDNHLLPQLNNNNN